jgi:hypothetical protein
MIKGALSSLLAAGIAVASCSALPVGPGGSSALTSAEPTLATSGCGPAKLPALPDGFERFTPVEERMSNPPSFPIVRGMTRVSSVDTVSGFDGLTPTASPPGLSLQDVLVSGLGTDADPYLLVLLYAEKPVGDEETLPEFLGRGGVFVEQKLESEMGQAADVVAELDDRAVVVQVGPHEAALVHADPVESNEIRPYQLYWSDGERDWSIGGVVPPEQVIDLARSLYCT